MSIEKEVLQENLREAIEDAKKPDPSGNTQGKMGIIIGVVGFFLPTLFQVFAGFLCGILGIYANKHGNRKLGIACGIITLVDILPLLFGINLVSFL